jgi:membrane-associated phospholipid phosphatase
MNPSTDPLRASTSRPGWKHEIWQRIRLHFALKMVGTSVFTWLFFIGYFHLLRQPVNPVTVMPLTAIDRLVPFQPQALIAYFSLWIYVGVAPGLQLRFNDLVLYGVWIAALCLTGLGFFYLWPTQVPAIHAGSSDFPGFAILQGVDAAGNACPSMHVAVAIFTAVWVDHILRQCRVPLLLRWLNVLWFLAIAYSTLAVKQHVLLDVIAGAVLGGVFALASLRWHPAGWAQRREQSQRPQPLPASGYHEARPQADPRSRPGGAERMKTDTAR